MCGATRRRGAFASRMRGRELLEGCGILEVTLGEPDGFRVEEDMRMTRSAGNEQDDVMGSRMTFFR